MLSPPAFHWPLNRTAIVDLFDLTKASFDFLALRLVNMLCEFTASHFRFGEAGRLLRRRIPRHDRARAIGRDDEVARALDNACEMQLHSANFLAKLKQVCYVVHDEDRASRRVAQLKRADAVRIGSERNAGRAVSHPLSMNRSTGACDVPDLLVERRVLEGGRKDFVELSPHDRIQVAARFLEEIVIDGQHGQPCVEDQDGRRDRRHHSMEKTLVVQHGDRHPIPPNSAELGRVDEFWRDGAFGIPAVNQA